MEHSEFSMEQDDAGMVNQILQELSHEDTGRQVNMPTPQQQPLPQQPLPQQGMMPMPEPIGQSIVHPNASILTQNVNTISEPDVKQSSENSWWSVILTKIKKPTTLILLIFLVFSPLTRKLLNKYVPVVFRSTSYLHQNISILILSVVVGLSFMLLDKLL